MQLDYQINPIRMGGLVKEIGDNLVKVHLHGRLGVIEVPESLIRGSEEIAPGYETAFYFSYIQVVERALDYDVAELTMEGAGPCLMGGRIIEVNDTAAKMAMMNGLGTIAVPRRWMFTPVELKVGQNVEFYFSAMDVVSKQTLPGKAV